MTEGDCGTCQCVYGDAVPLHLHQIGKQDPKKQERLKGANTLNAAKPKPPSPLLYPQPPARLSAAPAELLFSEHAADPRQPGTAQPVQRSEHAWGANAARARIGGAWAGTAAAPPMRAGPSADVAGLLGAPFSGSRTAATLQGAAESFARDAAASHSYVDARTANGVAEQEGYIGPLLDAREEAAHSSTAQTYDDVIKATLDFERERAAWRQLADKEALPASSSLSSSGAIGSRGDADGFTHAVADRPFAPLAWPDENNGLGHRSERALTSLSHTDWSLHEHEHASSSHAQSYNPFWNPVQPEAFPAMHGLHSPFGSLWAEPTHPTLEWGSAAIQQPVPPVLPRDNMAIAGVSVPPSSVWGFTGDAGLAWMPEVPPSKSVGNPMHAMPSAGASDTDALRLRMAQLRLEQLQHKALRATAVEAAPPTPPTSHGYTPVAVAEPDLDATSHLKALLGLGLAGGGTAQAAAFGGVNAVEPGGAYTGASYSGAAAFPGMGGYLLQRDGNTNGADGCAGAHTTRAFVFGYTGRLLTVAPYL